MIDLQDNLKTGQTSNRAKSAKTTRSQCMTDKKTDPHLTDRHKKSLGELTDSELQQRRANALVTALGCSGHTKSAQNQTRVDQYDWEMSRRGIEVDKYVEGKLNGEGSF